MREPLPRKDFGDAQWVWEFMYKYFQSSTGPTPEYTAWARKARRWIEVFLIGLGVDIHKDLVWSNMHFEWSCFFKLGDQWWYINCGDIRLKMGWMLLRKADGPKDYTGKRNQQVVYDALFCERFKKELGLS